MSVSTFLHDEFERRRARNARYSLRAFARALEIDHSTLSKMGRGKRAVPDFMLERIARRLGMAKAELEHRCEMEQLDEVVLSVVIDGSEHSSQRLAAQIGVEVDQVNIALHRLMRLGLLAMQGTVWHVSNGARS